MGRSNKQLTFTFIQTFKKMPDKEAYLKTFKTSARVILFEEQKLGAEFLKREHSKPLFTNPL